MVMSDSRTQVELSKERTRALSSNKAAAYLKQELDLALAGKREAQREVRHSTFA